MFFGSEATVAPAEKYADILAITRAADRLGFRAVWLPERHFQDFGQVFPSPAVLGAGLATVTDRIEIRAGSVVLPLHHPLRVAEEWAVVDNLSGGRVGLSIATGWHSTDFVLAPDAFADRRERALDGVTLLRRLWRGESVELTDGTGNPVAVRPRPAPVKPHLPLWLTTSGNPQTWAAAGRLRTGILGAAIGQTPGELQEKIKTYRSAYASASVTDDQDRPTVTLMLHAYAGESDAAVRDRVREPLLRYLRSYVRQSAASRAGAREQAVSALGEDEHRRLAEFAFERYLAWGSLLGSPARCRDVAAEMRDLGVDELACFVDFGLDRDEVLASLHRLAALHDRIG